MATNEVARVLDEYCTSVNERLEVVEKDQRKGKGKENEDPITKVDLKEMSNDIEKGNNKIVEELKKAFKEEIKGLREEIGNILTTIITPPETTTVLIKQFQLKTSEPTPSTLGAPEQASSASSAPSTPSGLSRGNRIVTPMESAAGSKRPRSATGSGTSSSTSSSSGGSPPNAGSKGEKKKKTSSSTPGTPRSPSAPK